MTSDPSNKTVNSKVAFIFTIGLIVIGFWLQSREKDNPRNVAERPAKPAVVEDVSAAPDASNNSIKNGKSDEPAERSVPSTPELSPAPPKPEERSIVPKKPAVKAETKISNVTVRNQDGKVIFQGTVDLAATLARIDAGRTLQQFAHDGTVFQNREGKLPRKSTGYYREYVHPTPNTSGPGPQRVVAGKDGEAYYTHDHYETFSKVR